MVGMTDSTTHMSEFADFIQASPSSYHAAAEVGRRLAAAGFTELSENAAWSDDGAQRAFVIRDGGIIAWVRSASAGPTTPVRVLGAHTDSPGFKLKPKPTVLNRGWVQAGVEVYGGPLLNSWLDRELEFAGRLVLRDGTEHLVRTGPFARIPQLAIHLDRDANSGLKLDRQRHMQPVLGVVTDAGSGAADVVGQLAAFAGVAPEAVAGYDVLTVDSQEPRLFGADQKLFAAGRMDNLSSVFAGLQALLATAAALDDESGDGAQAAAHTSVLAAFDHEELGSESRSGAAGPFLADVLTRIVGGTESERLQAFAGSWCVSADAGHAVHPNYADKHDDANQPLLGGGPLLKINANQRYATDAHGAALWHRASEQAGVPVQEFVSDNTVPCGSTIGPLTATRLGIRTVDVGIPLLSMHSARELCHADDVAGITGAIGAFFAGA